ncbi:MAG: SpoIIE family protein phosphatase [Candidatus Muiribacteriota bacterium]
MNRKIYEKFSIEDWIRLVSINNAIVSELQLDKVLILILKNALSSINAMHGSLMLFDDEESDTLKIAVAVGIPHNIIKKVKIKVGEGISGEVARTGEPVLIQDVEHDPVFARKNRPRYFTKSCLSVPLVFKNKVIGVFNVNDKKNSKQFTEKDLIFSNTLASQAAIAIENAKLYMQVKKDKVKLENLNVELEESLFALSEYTEELFVFHEFTKKIFDKVITYMDLDELTGKICELFMELEPIKSDLVILNFFDKNIFKVYSKSGEEKNFSSSEKEIILKISDYCQKNNESMRIPFEEERYKFFEQEALKHYNSLLSVPLYGKSGSIGVLTLVKKNKKSGLFDEKIRNLMLIFSLQVSTALSLVSALEEVMKKKVMENELKVAAKIQKMFLPRENPLVPGLELSHINIPTFEVGGDYIDFLWHNNSNLGISIGDVSGKGIPASLIMALTKSIVKSNVTLYDSPKELLEKINYELLTEIEGHRFVTMAFGFYNWETRKLEIAKAGHNPPLIFKKSGEIISINPQGLFLGMFRDCIIRQEEYNLDVGDVLVLYTDGVIDAEDSKGVNFGLKKMEKIIRDNIEKSPEEIKDKLIKKLENFYKGQKQNDDISIIICKAIDYFERKFIISSNKSQIPRLHWYIQNLLKMKGYENEDLKFKIRLIIDEILSNAIEHGNKYNDNRNIAIYHKITSKNLTIKIIDEGKGFNWQEKISKQCDINIKSERGRGIIIVKELCSSIKYNKKGNEVTIKIDLE